MIASLKMDLYQVGLPDHVNMRTYENTIQTNMKFASISSKLT